MSEQKETKKTIKILRYRPDINKEPYYETFEVPQKDDTVVFLLFSSIDLPEKSTAIPELNSVWFPNFIILPWGKSCPFKL